MVEPMTTETSRFTNAVEETKQCQNCFVSERELKEKGQKLSSCSECKRAHYCGRECQRLHWKTHKPQCIINRQTKAHMKAQTVIDPNGFQSVEVEKHYKKWLQEYRLILYNAVISAFELKKHPENCSRNILTVLLSPTFLPGQRKVDPKKAFNITGAQVDLISEIPDLQMRVAAEQAISEVPALKKQDPTVLGLALVHIVIPVSGQGATIRHLVPLGINDAQNLHLMRINPEWKDDLMMCVRRGISFGPVKGKG